MVVQEEDEDVKPSKNNKSTKKKGLFSKLLGGGKQKEVETNKFVY
jgi:hypothetical protein